MGADLLFCIVSYSNGTHNSFCSHYRFMNLLLAYSIIFISFQLFVIIFIPLGLFYYVHALFLLSNFSIACGFSVTDDLTVLRVSESVLLTSDILTHLLLQTGLEKNVFGNHPVPVQGAESRTPPPAFASEPLVHASDTVDKNAVSTARPANLDILEVDGYGSGTSSLPNHEPDFLKNTSPTGVRYFYILVFMAFALHFHVLC